jgi:hypothetical protein
LTKSGENARPGKRGEGASFRKKRREKDFPMARRSTHLRSAIALSLLLHGGLFALLLLAIFSAQSAPVPQTASLPKGVAGDPLPVEREDGGMVFIAPRPKGPTHARFDTPDIVPVSHQIEPRVDALVRPVVAVQRQDALNPLMPPRKLPNLASIPLEQTSGGTGGQGVSGGNVGSPNSATFFAVPTAANRVVFVLDGSASMGQSQAWNVARSELIAALGHMKPGGRCKVIIYAGTPRLLLPGRTDWLDPHADRQAMLKAMDELEPEGRTEHGPALKMAIALRPEAIYFLTDADDLTQDHLQDVQRINREGIPIHTIELTQRHRGQVGMPMQVLARRWNGVYQAIDLATWRPRQP